MNSSPSRTVLFNTETARPRAKRGWVMEGTRLVGLIYLKLTGWKIAGDFPRDVEKAVLVAAPHTSNWDGFTMIATASYYRIPMRWMGKKSLTDGPFGWLLRAVGCIGIDRKASKDLVSQMADEFSEPGTWILSVAPEGTRAHMKKWRSGFYHIAHAANAPIVISVLDYKTKVITLPGMIFPSGDYEAELPWIQSHYIGVRGKHGEQFQTVV